MNVNEHKVCYSIITKNQSESEFTKSFTFHLSQRHYTLSLGENCACFLVNLLMYLCFLIGIYIAFDT